MLILEDQAGRILLEKRGPSGIWGGLWSLPEATPWNEPPTCPLPGATMQSAPGANPPPVRHGFTHFELLIQPYRYRIVDPGGGVLDDNTHIWYNPKEPQPVGLPEVIKRLVNSIQHETPVLPLAESYIASSWTVTPKDWRIRPGPVSWASAYSKTYPMKPGRNGCGNRPY